MTPEQTIKTIARIKKDHPGNLMARFFDPDWFRALDTDEQRRLQKIINTGISNPDSEMGAYAMHPNDYERFAHQFDPMIRAFHAIPDDRPIAQSDDWNTGKTRCNLAAIDPALAEISMRVRVARNLSTFPLPGAMNRQQRIAFEQMVIKSLETLFSHKDFGGKYLSITPGTPHSITSEEYERRVLDHQMFKDMSGDRYLEAAGISNDWPFGRGMYISQNEDFIIWVGEEDHLRIMSMQTGGDLNRLFERLHTGLKLVSGLLPPFATSPKYGAIASCPTNLGAGMRASLHARLPNLCADDPKLSRLTTEAKKLGLAVRGAGGEHSAAGEGGLVDISPSARLGVTQVQIMQRLHNGVAALWKLEKALATKETPSRQKS